MENGLKIQDKVERRIEPLYSASEVAERLAISRSLAYQLIHQGQIPSIVIGRLVRVRASDLERFIESRARGSF